MNSYRTDLLVGSGGSGSLRNLLLAAVCATAVMAASARAQVPPNASEVARYTGIHAAAHSGNAAQIESVIASGADVNRRDAYGRSALHIATFARKSDAVRTLIKGGAKTELLENDKYDAVTVAAVAGDEATLRVLLSNGASAKLPMPISLLREMRHSQRPA